MSAQIDFLALYRELGIDPDCAPEALKRAYRRRVSELHPDRSGEGVAGEEALKSLNLGYAAALEFFHVHGRFPGASASAGRARQARAAAPAATPSPMHVQAPDEPAPAPEGLRQRRWLSLVLVVLALLVVGSQLAGRGEDGDAPAPDAYGIHAAPGPGSAARSMAAALELGLSADAVLATLGAPTDTAEDGRLWHYGPSWIRLSCREVVDWYSSPLKPLGLSSMHSGAGNDGHAAAAACAELDPALNRRY